MSFKQVAIKAAKEAGKIQLKYFGKDYKKKKKDGDSFVTEVDIKCTNIIRKTIHKQFPAHDILDEEIGHIKRNSDYKWIVDPMDGTHNYIMDNPLFGISIALEHKKEIILGVIFMPILKKLYYAEKGKGAFCNGKRIKVNKQPSLNKSLFIFDSKLRSETNKKINILSDLAKMTWRMRVWGAAIYHNIQVAEGKAAFNIDFSSNPWDHSAALFLVEEAGGKVTDLDGKRWNVYTKDYIASNGKVHDKVLKVLKK